MGKSEEEAAMGHLLVTFFFFFCIVLRIFNTRPTLFGASLVTQTVKNLPAVQETWV